MTWDPATYGQFADERARPFFDLVGQVRVDDPRSIVDLGCGAGAGARTLAERWPAARVVGVDNSEAMLACARPLAIPGRLEFVHGQIEGWTADRPVDLLVSNAACHWVSDHERLIPRLAGAVGPRGALAIQMPNNFRSPSHLAIYDTAAEPRWEARLAGVGLHRDSVLPLTTYAERLLGLGFEVNAWETTYVHVLRGEDPVLVWLRGTALRPILSALEPAEVDEFQRRLAARLRLAYPATGDVTLLPMSRVFFVAKRSCC